MEHSYEIADARVRAIGGTSAGGDDQEVCGCYLKQPRAKTATFCAFISTKNRLQVKPSFSAVVSDPAFRMRFHTTSTQRRRWGGEKADGQERSSSGAVPDLITHRPLEQRVCPLAARISFRRPTKAG